MRITNWFIASLVVLLITSNSIAAGIGQYFPKGKCKELVQHKYYSLCYSPDHRQAIWTAHELTVAGIRTRRSRTNNFRPDSMVNDPVQSTDYRGSGYDRGHLVPAADMKITAQAMSESFFMSNMSPQMADFNRKIWATLENNVRGLVLKHGDGIVITAPVLKSALSKIRSGVAIPEWYYKILYLPEDQLMFAYLMPHKDLGKQSPDKYAVSVDEIENITGFDFFSNLPDDLEDRLEGFIQSN